MTKYEKEILRIVTVSYEHLTAEQIFSRLKKTHPKVVLATIYNNRNRLLDAGLIQKITTEGMPDRYDRPQRHDHLVCRHCGKLSDVKLQDLTESLHQQLGGKFLYYDLKVYYVCPECQKKYGDTDI